MTRLDAIAQRLAAATPGEWEVYDPNEGSVHGALWSVANDAYHNPSSDEAFGAYVECGGRADADLIAHAPADLAALLAVARAAQQVIGCDPRSLPDAIARNRLRDALADLDEDGAT